MSTMTKTDCFAYRENKCSILKERYCDREKCNFYRKAEAKDLKQPKKLTRAQKIFLSSKKLKPECWMLVEETSDALIIYSKKTKKVKEVKK